MAYALWHRAGKQAAILSGRRAQAVERRAAELKIAHVLQGHEQKAAPLRSLIEGLGFRRVRSVSWGTTWPIFPCSDRRPGRLPG